MEKETRQERLERFTRILTKSRQKSNVSQEHMAAELGVSRRTIQNWEMGNSCPTFFQVIEWFRVLGQNPASYYREFLYPEAFKDLEPSDDDDRISDALQIVFNNLSIAEKRTLLYLFHSDHGSSTLAILQMLLAHLHTDMKSRVLVGRMILESFEMSEKRDELVNTDCIMPDLDIFQQAIEKCKQAAIKRESGYSAELQEFARSISANKMSEGNVGQM